MKLDSADLEFLRRFARSPEGKLWVGILQRNQSGTDVRLRTSTGEELFRQQGRAQLLAELLDQVTEAEKKIERSATHRRTVALPAEWKA